MRILLALVLSSLAFGQSARSVTPPIHTATTVNYYISTAGSDSNPCTSASKCLTIAHVRTLIPVVVDNQYIINVADGTYAGAIDMSGFVGTGVFRGPSTSFIKILGNIATPANVVFTGNIDCLPDYTGYTAGACIASSAQIILSSLRIAPSASHYGVLCNGGNVELNNVQIHQTGVAADETDGGAFFACDVVLTGTNVIDGFNTDISPVLGIGFIATFSSDVACQNGTTTITGPGTGSSASAFGTYGMTMEQGAHSFQMHGGCTLNISGVQFGLVINANAAFLAYDGAETIHITNGTTTPTTSQGITTNSGGIFELLTGITITIDHYTICVVANDQASGILRTGGSYSGTNCTPTSTPNNGQTVGF